MDKVTYYKIKRFNIFGFEIFKTYETYVEHSKDDIDDNYFNIEITKDYYNQEFGIDSNRD